VNVASVTATHALLPSESVIETTKPETTQGASGTSFAELLGKTVEQASEADRAAASKVDALARGVNDDLHGTMIAVKEADISIKLVGTIRNKLLDAFQEIWKTSV